MGLYWHSSTKDRGTIDQEEGQAVRARGLAGGGQFRHCKQKDALMFIVQIGNLQGAQQRVLLRQCAYLCAIRRTLIE